MMRDRRAETEMGEKGGELDWNWTPYALCTCNMSLHLTSLCVSTSVSAVRLRAGHWKSRGSKWRNDMAGKVEASSPLLLLSLALSAKSL